MSGLCELPRTRVQSLSDPCLNANFSGREFPRLVVDLLRVQGHDVRWVRTDFPGTKDHALLELAEADRRLIVTPTRIFGSSRSNGALH